MESIYRVTVVTPSYNQGQFIERTILSVLNQTYSNIQYIVVDGGSTDNTMDIVNRYKDRIDIVIHEKDKGQSDAINKGFKLATGELVGWINSDDLLYPHCVEKIVDLARQKPNGIIYYGSKLDRIDCVDKTFAITELKIPNRKYLINNNYSVIQQGSFYRTEAVRNIGYVDASIFYCMDLDLWLRLLANGSIYSIDESPVAAFRMWEESKTSTGNLRFLDDIRKVLKRNGMRFFSSNNFRLNYRRAKLILKHRLK